VIRWCSSTSPISISYIPAPFPAAPTSPFPPPPLGFPSTRRYRTLPPRPKASSAPHHPPEAIPPLLRHPPSPQPAERRPPSPPVRTQPTPPSIITFYSISDQIKLGESIPALPRCSRAPCSPMFTGPSPGTTTRRRGRHHLSSPAVLRHCSSSTSPSIVFTSSCRSCSTYPSPPRTSPPARTPWIETLDTVESRQGHICDIFFYSWGL
jgi:hypothetical protein